MCIYIMTSTQNNYTYTWQNLGEKCLNARVVRLEIKFTFKINFNIFMMLFQ